MGIREFKGSTAEAVKRNAPDATTVKGACRSSSTYATAALTKISEAVAAPVKTVYRKSYECGSTAFAKIDHTVRTKPRRKKAADHTDVMYEAIVPAEKVGIERGTIDLDACENSCSYVRDVDAFAKIEQTVVRCRITHTNGFIIFAKIGYTVRVKGAYRIIQWMSANGIKCIICTHSTNFAQNDDELHKFEEGDKLIPGRVAGTPVKIECRNFYTIDFITFARIGYVVRVKVLYGIGQWMADEDNKSRMIMYATIFAENARLYTLQYGCKLIPDGFLVHINVTGYTRVLLSAAKLVLDVGRKKGKVAFFMILSNSLVDIRNENDKPSKEFIHREEMHEDDMKSVPNDENDSFPAANGSLKDEVGYFAMEFLVFMVKEAIGFMSKEPSRTQLFNGDFMMESFVIMTREIICAYLKQHFGAQFISQMDEMVGDILRELFGAKFFNELGFRESASKGKKTKKKKKNKKGK